MAEPSLALGYADYFREVRQYLGISSSPSSDETSLIQSLMDSGLRKFYSASKWS